MCCDVIWRVVLCCAVLCCLMLCYAVFCVVQCSAVLCWVVLCYVGLCCVVLCCVVLCCAVLCCVMFYCCVLCTLVRGNHVLLARPGCRSGQEGGSGERAAQALPTILCAGWPAAKLKALLYSRTHDRRYGLMFTSGLRSVDIDGQLIIYVLCWAHAVLCRVPSCRAVASLRRRQL